MAYCWVLKLQHTFSLRMVNFPLPPTGYITFKYRSAAIATRVKTEEEAPTHAMVPCAMQKTLPVTPPG